MKVVQINGGVFGSTGKIMFGITKEAEKNNIQTKCFSPITTTNRKKQPDFPYEKIGTFRTRQFNVLTDRITGFNGCSAFIATKKLLRKIASFSPNIIHLHNLHNSYINLPMLFRFIKKHNIPVVWTLHDCWAFTGKCTHYTVQNCNKWQSGCYKCPQYKHYPKSYVDRTKAMWKLKKKWFTGVPNMTIVTPSDWLAGQVKQSFLGEYDVKVINNGIDLSVFKPAKSDFRKKYGLENKKILLGVSFEWEKSKGFNDFIELSRLLNDEYKIVLVGVSKEQIASLPQNIIGIERTSNQKELAEIYSAADVFINPSREETMGLVTVEAIACGTPAVTYNQTAVPEKITEVNGIVVEAGDVNGLIKAIDMALKLDKTKIPETVLNLGYHDKYKEYINLYTQITSIGEGNRTENYPHR